jgi:hypothetical protein
MIPSNVKGAAARRQWSKRRAASGNFAHRAAQIAVHTEAGLVRAQTGRD